MKWPHSLTFTTCKLISSSSQDLTKKVGICWWKVTIFSNNQRSMARWFAKVYVHEFVPNLLPFRMWRIRFCCLFWSRFTTFSLQKKRMEHGAKHKFHTSYIPKSKHLNFCPPRKTTCLLTSDTSRATFSRTCTGMTRVYRSGRRIQTGDFGHAGHMQFPLHKP